MLCWFPAVFVNGEDMMLFDFPSKVVFKISSLIDHNQRSALLESDAQWLFLSDLSF